MANERTNEASNSPLFGDPVSPWHFWFAWRPVFTWDRRFVWLHRIHRRLIQKHQYLSTGGNDQWWQYHFESGYVPNPKCTGPEGNDAP